MIDGEIVVFMTKKRDVFAWIVSERPLVLGKTTFLFFGRAQIVGEDRSHARDVIR